MNTHTNPGVSRRSGFAALMAALQSAMQWKLLLLWLLATLVPTWLATFPLWGALQAQFGQSLHASDIAAGHNLPLLIQGLMKLSEQVGPIVGGTFAAALLMLLVSPWLTGMIVASLRAGRRLGFGELVHGGLTEYWRMLRMLLWSMIPIGIALAVAAGLMHLADKTTEQAILSSEVSNASRMAMIVAAIVFVIAHAGVEAGRGWLGADGSLRSVIRAWWRGFKLLLRRPLATLAVYLGSCIIGLGLALVLAWLRIRIDGVGGGAALASLLLTQLMVAALAWSRITRLYGLSDLAGNAIARNAGAAKAATAPGGQTAAATA